MGKLLDLTGKKFGSFLVLEREKNKLPTKWVCQCECGNVVSVFTGNLTRGHSKSCGCVRPQRTHNMSNSPEYISWKGMLARCKNKNTPNYGARGIKVCKRWLKFENFYEDMGKKPSIKHSIDRIDFNGDYEPRNCRWANRKEQARNTRNQHLVYFDGVVVPLIDAAEKTSLKYNTILTRIIRGWSAADALLTPNLGNGGRRK